VRSALNAFVFLNQRIRGVIVDGLEILVPAARFAHLT